MNFRDFVFATLLSALFLLGLAVLALHLYLEAAF